MKFITKIALGALAVFSLGALGLSQSSHALPGMEIFPPKVIGATKAADEFPELPADLREGCDYNQQKVLDAIPASNNQWYVVPKWFAGEFAYGEMTVVSEKDFVANKVIYPATKTAASNSGRHRGMLVDKKGNIWQLSKGGEIRNSLNKDEKDYHRFDNDIFGIMISPKEYLEISESIEFFVDDASKITKVMRMQRVRDFVLEEKDSVYVALIETHFDLKGQRVLVGRAEGRMKKVNDFVPMTAENERFKGEYSEAVAHLRTYLTLSNREADDAP